MAKEGGRRESGLKLFEGVLGFLSKDEGDVGLSQVGKGLRDNPVVSDKPSVEVTEA
jgi:hypothetical protein